MYKCVDCKTKITRWGYRCQSCAKLNELNPKWGGDNVDLGSLHEWVKRRFPKPRKCNRCDKKPIDLANIGHNYSRDLSNWEWLCRSCHMKQDGRIENHLKKIRNNKVKINKRWLKYACEKYNTINDVADYLEVSRFVVSRRIKAWGIKKPGDA